MAKRKALPRLGELELAVLERLWNIGEADVQAMHASIGKKRGISSQTVGSAMERLFKKGLLRRSKVSYAFVYRPALDREAFTARKVLDAAGSVRALAQSGVLAAFVDLLADEDEHALAELERLVQERREEQR